MLCAGLIAASDRVFSRVMTWDLLFNLAGAWYLYNGQVAHVDFHDPVGSLTFWLTTVAFWFHGPTVFSFVLGQLYATALVFVAAVAASMRRLPLLPAVIFVVFTGLLVLMPTNVGDLLDDFTFAMSYNSDGWAILCVLSLVLFVPPDRETPRVPWIDLTICGASFLALYYLKITYFLAGLGVLAVALLVCDHVRTRWKVWVALGALVLANALAPYNWPYLADIYLAVASGAVRTKKLEMLVMYSANVPELSLYFMMLLIAVALWRSNHAPARLPLVLGALIIGGLAVLSQNAQLRGLPICTAASFLLYDQFRRNMVAGRWSSTWALLAVLVFPVANIVHTTTSAILYNMRTKGGAPLFVVDQTRLRGLAVPLDAAISQQSFSTRGGDATLLGRARSAGGSAQISQFEYVQTILEAAAWFDETKAREGGIVILDQVNPLPFVLGWTPPRGVSLWLDLDFPWQPAEVMFADADYVLIPKFSTYREATERALQKYETYLSQQFPVRVETRSWIILSRRSKT